MSSQSTNAQPCLGVGPGAHDRDPRGQSSTGAERRLDATIISSLDTPTPRRVCAGGSLSVEASRPAITTEITVLGGDRYRVEGTAEDIERAILNAARGSIMEFAWFNDADTGERIGINPEHVVVLRVHRS